MLRSLYCNLLLSILKKSLLTIIQKGYIKALLRRDIRSDLRPNDSSPLFGDINVLFRINNYEIVRFLVDFRRYFKFLSNYSSLPRIIRSVGSCNRQYGTKWSIDTALVEGCIYFKFVI